MTNTTDIPTLRSTVASPIRRHRRDAIVLWFMMIMFGALCFVVGMTDGTVAHPYGISEPPTYWWHSDSATAQIVWSTQATTAPRTITLSYKPTDITAMNGRCLRDFNAPNIIHVEDGPGCTATFERPFMMQPICSVEFKGDGVEKRMPRPAFAVTANLIWFNGLQRGDMVTVNCHEPGTK